MKCPKCEEEMVGMYDGIEVCPRCEHAACTPCPSCAEREAVELCLAEMVWGFEFPLSNECEACGKSDFCANCVGCIIDAARLRAHPRPTGEAKE